MSEIEDEIEKLEDRIKHLKEVKESIIKAQEVLPYVQHDIDITDWRIRLYQDMPSEAAEIPKLNNLDHIEQENKFLFGLYKTVDIPDVSQMVSGTAITSSGATSDYSFVSRVKSLGTPIALEYSEAFIVEYQKMQDIQNKPIKIRSMLVDLNNDGILKRFDEAIKLYLEFKNGSGERTAAANSIRNLIYGLKGVLWELAIDHKGENMTWKIMVGKLAKNGEAGQEFKTLLDNEEKQRSLLEQLASVLKDREGQNTFDINDIWVETLDYIYTVLGLLK